MATCINRNTKEFKDLLELSDYSPVVLAAKIESWQNKNNTEKIPESLKELSGSPVVNLSDLEVGNIKTIYSEKPELQQIGTEQEYLDFNKTASEVTVEGFKEFVEESKQDDVDDAFSLDINPDIDNEYRNKVDALINGKTLPEGAVTELKTQLSNLIYDSIRDRRYLHDFKFNQDTGRLSSVELSEMPGSTKLSSPKRSLQAAKRLANDINNKYLHKLDKDKYPIVKVQPTKKGGRLTFREATRLSIYRGNFAFNTATVTSRLMNRQFARKAIEMLRLEGRLTVEQYQKIILDNKLMDLKLTEDEMRLTLSEDTRLPLQPANIDGGQQHTIEEREDAHNKREAEIKEELDAQDEMPDFSDTIDDIKSPINLEKLKLRREAQIDLINKRIKNLEGKRNVTGNSKLYAPKIKFLKEVKEKFETEYSNELVFSDPKEALRISFTNDINVIKDIQKNPTQDNMFLVRNLLGSLRANIKETSQTHNEENVFFANLSKEQQKEIEDLMDEFSQDYVKLERSYENIVDKLFIEVLENYEQGLQDLYPGLSLEEIKDKLKEKLKEDTDIVSGNLGSLGSDLSVNDVVGALIRAEYETQKAIQDAEANPLRQKVDNVAEKTKKILEKMGLSNSSYTNWLEVFSRTTSNGDLELVSKYSEKWKRFVDNAVKNTMSNIIKASKEKDYNKINELYSDKYRLLNQETDFIDLHRISELATEYRDHPLLSGQFEVDEKYSKDLKKRLGEEEYNNLVQRQVNFIEEFMLERRRIFDSFYQRYEVDGFDDLSTEVQDRLEQAIERVDPFFFAKNRESFGNQVPLQMGTQVVTLPHTLNYNTFIPKADKSDYYDDKYKKISDNPDLFKAWQVFNESVTTINENLAGNSSLDLSKRSLTYMKKEIREKYMNQSWGKRLYKSSADKLTATKDWFTDPLTTSLVKKSDFSEINLPGNVSSFKSKVNSEFTADKLSMTNLLGKKVTSKTTLTRSDMSLEFKEEMAKVMGTTIGQLDAFIEENLVQNKLPVYAFKKLSQAKIIEQQSLNLPKLLKMLLEQSSDYKARENSLKILEDIIEPATNRSYEGDGKTIKEKTRLKEKKETFKTSVLRGQRNTAGLEEAWNINFSKSIENGGVPVRKSFSALGREFTYMSSRKMNPEEHRLHKLYTERVAQIDKLLETTTDEQIISDLEAERESSLSSLGKLGSFYTLNSVMEALAIKAFIGVKLGLNLKAAIMNRSQGMQQNYLQAGFRDSNNKLVGDYDITQLSVADAFVKSGLGKSMSSKRKQNELEKMSAFIDQLGIVQDGTDFEQRAERSGGMKAPSLNVLKKKNRKLLILTEFVEYYNQVPLILAVSQNYTMPDGNPIFNGKEFPYHDLKDGKLVLKDSVLNSFEGVTPEQLKEDYQSFTSKKGINFRSNLKNRLIPARNGDYSQSGAITAKTTSRGKMFMVFGNWVYGMLHSAYAIEQSNLHTGKKDWGYITRLLSSKEGRTLGMAPVVQNVINIGAMVTTSTAIMSSIPYMAVPAAAILGGWYMLKGRNKVHDASEETMSKSEWAGNWIKLFSHGMTVQTAKMGLSGLNGFINLLSKSGNTKKEKSNMFDFDYTFGGKIDETTALALSKASKQQAVMNWFSILHVMTVMALSGMGAGEEEDELKSNRKERKKQYKRRQEKANLYKVKHLVNNLLAQAYTDASITTSPQNLLYSLVGEEDSSHLMSVPTEGLSAGLSAMFGSEKVTKSGDMYFGESKWLVGARKAFLPPMIRNIDKVTEDNWFFGLEMAAQKSYRTTTVMEMFDHSDLKVDKKEIAKERKLMRGNLKVDKEYEKTLSTSLREKFIIKYGGLPDYQDLDILDRDLADKQVNSYVDSKKPTPNRRDYTEDQEKKTEAQREKEIKPFKGVSTKDLQW